VAEARFSTSHEKAHWKCFVNIATRRRLNPFTRLLLAMDSRRQDNLQTECEWVTEMKFIEKSFFEK
jgi:predicted DNA-binding ribbon-helix-helix protein